jgi:hypothetical protein
MISSTLTRWASCWALAGLSLAAFTGATSKATPLCGNGETNLYCFATAKGKIVSVCVGPQQKYLVYRFGTAQKVELQYPAVLDASSWRKFTFASYMRPSMGGSNSGRDLNHLQFVSGKVRYTVFCDFSDEEGEKVGVNVNLGGGKEVFIKGLPKSVQGGLADLRDNDKVTRSEEGL